MRKFILVSLLIVAPSVNAQVVTDSAQCHWLVNGVMSHTHVDLTYRRYDVVTGQVVYNATFTLFHVDGYIGLVSSELGDFIWDDNTWNPYRRIIGNPNGVVIVTAKYVLNPFKRNPSVIEGPTAFVDHGWAAPRLLARTFFNNGTETDTSLFIPLYSMLNPSSPETIPTPSSDKLLRAACEPRVPGWGTMISEYKQVIIPTDPINATYPAQFEGYNYAGFQDGFVDRRLDPDLHNGVIGTKLNNLAAFDITEIPTGKHKISNIWHQLVNGEEAVVQLVHEITVGSIVIEPPPPPPPVDWHDINGKFQRLNDSIRICDTADSKCTDPVVIH